MNAPLKLPAVNPLTLPEVEKTGYPAPFSARVKGRRRRRLGEHCGLTQFGVNLTTLAPGAQSALRHWHTHEDEFVYVVSGELVLVSDAGEQRLMAGHCAGFAAGIRDGHHLINRSALPAQYLEIGSKAADDLAEYPDDDVMLAKSVDAEHILHKNWTPYE